MKISVVIPVYNAEKHIARAIESVLAQTRPAEEIIVVDDGSTDATAEVVRSFGDKVILIQQPNAGVSVARNKGIERASGDWIAFLDSDDEWLPEKLKLQSEHLSRNPDLKWTYANFHQKLSSSDRLQLAHMSGKISMLLKGREYFEDYLQSYVNYAYAWTCTLMIHRSVFDSVGLFKPGMKRAQDTDLWFRVAYQFPRVGYVPEPLAIYHLDTVGSSTKINDSADFMIDLVRRHEELSIKYNRDEAFRPCIAQMVQARIRQFEKQRRRKDVAKLMDLFNVYLPGRFCREMQFRLAIPFFGPMIAKTVHWLKEKRKR
ncbi:MAG: glycosyltransferase [Phycisphaerae bacterium]|nr:glycosyltransferase [Phycisphaerae bacterium]